MEHIVDQEVLGWLLSLGYNLQEKPQEDVAAMFLQEARQWQLHPEELAIMIKEGNDIRKEGQACRLHA